MNRTEWKAAYRTLRILRRENTKAAMDCLLYGTGVVVVTPGADPRHVPPADIYAPDVPTAWSGIVKNPPPKRFDFTLGGPNLDVDWL